MVDKLTERSLFAAVCVFLIVISIITVSRRSFPANTLLFHTSTERARPLEHVTVWSQPSIASKRAIRSTAETLYVMYGEGNFGDDNEHLLNYIRSMMSQQGPGGRHLCQESKVQYNPMGGAGVLDGLLNKRRNGFFCGMRNIWRRRFVGFSVFQERVKLDGNSDRGASGLPPPNTVEEPTGICVACLLKSFADARKDEIQIGGVGQRRVLPQQKHKSNG